MPFRPQKIRKPLDKQQHAPYYTYRDRHRKREFTFDKYEGIPEGVVMRKKAGLT